MYGVAIDAVIDVEINDRDKAKEIAENWLYSCLPRITPAGVHAEVKGPVDGGREHLKGGLNIKPRGEVVVIFIVVRQDGLKPTDPAPEWLTTGLKAAQVKGLTFLGATKAGAMFGG